MRNILLVLTSLLLLSGCAVARSVGDGPILAESITEAFPDPQVRRLAQAACAGDRARVAALVASGVDPNAEGMMLIGRGDILGQHPGDPLRAPIRPLSWMIHCHSPVGVEALVAAGANTELRLYNHLSLVEFAIRVDDMRVLQALLDAGSDPNTCGGSCPYRAAIRLWQRTGSWRALDILLASGLDIDRFADERREDRFRNTTFTGFLYGRSKCKALSFLQQGTRRNEAMALYIVRSFPNAEDECAVQLDALLTERVGEEAYRAWVRDFEADRERRRNSR